MDEAPLPDSTDDDVDESGDSQIEVGNESKKVVYQLTTPSIQTLYDQFKEGDLLLEPEYQRHFVWNRQKASNLIESVLLNIPLPLIYTAEAANNKEEVIDGQQRLTSLFSFIDGAFPTGDTFRLSKTLKVLSQEIGGKTFSELDKSYQKEIKRRSLQVISISKASQEDVKFEMFERLNTNITALNAQELRNCLYRGKYNDFLKRMASYDEYQFILNKPNYKQRMQDVANVLMFCAFFHTTPDRYSKSLTQMLNLEMRNRVRISDDEEAELEKQFRKSVRLVKHIWGDRAFNVFSVDPKTKHGEWSTQFNQGLFQILMYWFTPYETQQVIPHADLIREELLNLQAHDAEFMNTLTGSGTNSPAKVRKKFDIWGSTIKGILNYPHYEPRAFSIERKRLLWNVSHACHICGQQISVIDDAEVDHIICYWRGGRTIPENGRLSHRYCNRSKSGDI